MDLDHLSEDERALLDQIAPDTTLDELGGGPRRGAAIGTENDDDVLLEDDESEDDETPAGFVPKAEYDQLKGRLDTVERLFTTREAPTFTPPAAITPPAATPPAVQPPMSKEAREELVAKFFEDPIGFTNVIAQNAVAAERAKNETRHIDTTATIARGEVNRIRAEVLAEYPQYKGAMPAMDQLMKETPPETLAALMSSGKLRDVYMDNFKSKAFDVANRVNSAAVQRRRPAEEPPQLGARGLASVSSIDKVRAGNKVIRVSELDEVDREAVVQFRKLGFSDKEIAAELRKTS